MPITLLLVVPRQFHVELEKGLFGTLLTISPAWLVLYVLSWLDPKAAARQGATAPTLLSQLQKSGAS